MIFKLKVLWGILKTVILCNSHIIREALYHLKAEYSIPIPAGLGLGAHVRVSQLVVEDVNVLAAGVPLEDRLHLFVVDVVDLLLVVVKVPL